MINQKSVVCTSRKAKIAVNIVGGDIMECQISVRQSETKSIFNDQSDHTSSESIPAIIMVPETSKCNWFPGVDEELMRRLRG